jgi:PPOX class probable F420-dependent enzyme
MLTDEQRHFLESGQVARLATADQTGQPHVVPICYALIDDSLYFTIDHKPKRSTTNLKRLANIRANSKVALVVDRYDEDWSKLAWLMVQGEAAIILDGATHKQAQARLRERYPQLKRMNIDALPVVAIDISHVIAWGRLVG